MANRQPDIKPDIKMARDDGESTATMEPLLLGERSPHRRELTDLAFELGQKSAAFRSSLPVSLVQPLADLVRTMNCYYSNLIEGHATHPVDIERALKNDYSADAKKRNLQLEAKAHIAVQEWIDGGGVKGRPVEVDSIREIHRRFGELLPAELLLIKNPKTGQQLKMIPGEFRRYDVAVGQHVAVSPGAVPRFLARFQQVYSGLGRAETIIAAAAAHHRLAWIHPFLDGNGRVARLMSHAMLLDTLDTGGVWSVARGLARDVDNYKYHLAACDQPRHGDLDGRGNLSEEALASFSRFFITTCLDQVRFMESLLQPDRLRVRIRTWAEEEVRLGHLPPKSGAVLDAIIYRGELPRADLPTIVGTGDRQARRIVSALLEQEVLSSESTRAPLRLAFPAALAGRWMPGLFPARSEE